MGLSRTAQAGRKKSKDDADNYGKSKAMIIFESQV